MSNADNVVRLPDSMRRQWRAMEPELCSWLIGLGYTEAEAALSVNGIKGVYLRYATPKRVTIRRNDAEGGIADIEGWVKQLAIGLLMEVLMREVELIRLRGLGNES